MLFCINDKMASLSQSLFVPSMKRPFLPQWAAMWLLWAHYLSSHKNRRALLRLLTSNCKWTEDTYVNESWSSFPLNLRYFLFVGFVIFKPFPYLIGIDSFFKRKSQTESHLYMVGALLNLRLVEGWLWEKHRFYQAGSKDYFSSIESGLHL